MSKFMWLEIPGCRDCVFREDAEVDLRIQSKCGHPETRERNEWNSREIVSGEELPDWCPLPGTMPDMPYRCALCCIDYTVPGRLMSTVLADGQCQIVVTCTRCGAQLLPGGGTVRRNAEELTSVVAANAEAQRPVTRDTLMEMLHDLERENEMEWAARETDSHQDEGDGHAFADTTERPDRMDNGEPDA